MGKKWSLLIIGLLGKYEKLRYNELKEKLIGISPKALADRLKELASIGVIKRQVFAEVPARVEYSLTPEGQELRQSAIPLLQWSSKHSTSR